MSTNTMPPAPPRTTQGSTGSDDVHAQPGDNHLERLLEAAMTGGPSHIERLELDSADCDDEHAHVRKLFTELSQAALRAGTLDRNRHRKLSRRVDDALGDD